MLNELNRDEFYKIELLLRGDRVNIEIKAIAAGNNPGWVFVDDHNSPTPPWSFPAARKVFISPAGILTMALKLLYRQLF